jgi:hypothetical protein
MTTYSPYACNPVAIHVGPGLATYSVPKHLLRSPRWSTTDAGGTLCLPGVSAATGHTLVHYLYTGTYQTLETKGEDAVAPAHTKFKEAFLTFVLASAYELHDLERLAKEQIKRHGSHMALYEVLETVRKEFSKISRCWFHEYLQARAKEEFDLDYTFCTSKAFVKSVGEGTLHRFMTSHLLEIFSEKLTDSLQKRECCYLEGEKPYAVLDEVEEVAVKTHSCPYCHGGHQTGMNKGSDGMSFEFPNASCEDVADVMSWENSVCDEPPCSPPEPEPPAESVSEPGPVPDSSPTKGAEDIERKKEEEAPAGGDGGGSDPPADGGDGGDDKKGKKKVKKEAEEEERKKKEEEEAEAAAAADAAAKAANNLSWAEPTPGSDDWGNFAATTTTAGKKKKGKKGKVRHLAT